MSVTLDEKVKRPRLPARFWTISARAKTVNGKERLSILHVDDDPSVLKISKQILMDMGNFDVDSSSSVDEAFKKLGKHPYDAVVSDYEMPKKTGLDFLKELRLQKNETAFIMFTGKGSEEVAATALNLGAEGYYNKEGSIETVYEKLSQGITLLVEREHTQTSLMESKYHIQKIHYSTPSPVCSYDLAEQENIYELNQRGAENAETKASLEEPGHSASLPTIECDCGAKILVIPDLRAMNRAIERHAAEHRRMGINDEKDSDGHLKVKELLTNQLLKATSELGK